MPAAIGADIARTIDGIRTEKLFKTERELRSPQSATVRTESREVLNFCANNYLGLADDPRIVSAAKKATDVWGFGMASGMVHLRHPDPVPRVGAGGGRPGRDRGRDPVLVVLRRERGRLRGVVRA